MGALDVEVNPRYGTFAPETAAAVEFILEGLHLNKRLNKDKVGGKSQYRG